MRTASSKHATVMFLVCTAVILAGGAARAVVLQPDGSPTTGDANLRLWLDASDSGTLFQDTGGTVAAADGLQVALWKDKSGNGLDVSQATAADRPDYKATVANLNSNAALFFEGGAGGDMLRGANSTGILGNADRTVIAVWANRENTGQNYQHIFHMGTADGYRAYGISVAKNSSDRIGNHYYWAGYDTNASSTTDSMMAVAMWDGDGGSGTNGLDTWYVDGDAVGTHERAALNTGPTEVLIGSRVSGPTEGIRGDVAEIIVYDGLLDWQQQDALGKYLADKYGIASSYLGTGHIYDAVSAPGLGWKQARAATQLAAPPAGYNRGDLVSITSAEENTHVENLLGGSSAWIGANDAAVEGQWVWSDGSGQFWQGAASGHPEPAGAYNNWNANEPNNAGGEDYAAMYSGGGWNDLGDVHTRDYYVAEYTPNGTYHSFDGAGTNYTPSTFGSGTGPVVQSTDHTSNYIRMLHNTGSQQNVIAFDRTAKEAWEQITASFDLRLDPGADGMGFVLLNTDDFATTGAGPSLGAWEEPNLAHSFGVGFDIYSNIHEVSLHWNGEVVATSTAFDYRNGSTGPFNDVDVTIDYLQNGANVSVDIAGNAIFTDYFIEGMIPYESRAAFGARTGGAFTTLDLDNINIQYNNLWNVHVWGGGTGDYTDANQWNVMTVPTAADHPLIAAGQANSSNLALNGPGTLTVAGSGILNNSGTLFIGQAAASTGVFVQTGGTVNTSTLYLGGASDATGHYWMYGGSLNTSSYIVIGTSGTGHVHQDGGTVTQSGARLILGDVSGSTGNTYDMSGSAVLGAREFSLGDKAGSEGTFSISDSAQLTVASTAWIGLSGDGTVNQSGGTASFNSEFMLGQNSGASGAYSLSGSGQLTVANTAMIGNYGDGTVNQSGGTASFNNWLILGQSSGSTGTYNMSSGTLNVAGQYFIIGRSGVGHFNQSGDAVVNVNVTTRMMTNDFGGSSGSSYSISGGTLNVNNGVMLAVGKGDTGTFLQTGGTVNLSGDLSLGESGNGTYRLQGGALNVTGNITGGGGTGNLEFDGGTLAVTGGSINVDSLRMAVTGSANPTLTMTAGNTLNVGGDMYVGQNNQATVSLTDTTTTIGGRLRLAPYSGGNASLTQTGGSMSVGGRLELSDNAGATSTYTLGGDGTLTVGGDYLIVGRMGPGHFIQNDDSIVNLNVSQRFLIGDCGGGGADGSSYTLNGGTLNLNGGKQISIGKADDASFTQTGGTFNASGSMRFGEGGGEGVYNLQDGDLNVASYMTIGGSGTGIFNLEGGTLTVDSITAPNGTFNFTGGTLHAGTVGFALTNQGGTLAPGASPGTTVINGAYVQDDTSTLDIELAGYTPGTEFDLVTVNGSASLDGFLDVTMLGGALADEYDFVVLTASDGITDLGMDLSYSGPFRMYYSIIDLGGSEQGLQLAYRVPEPGSLILLALGSLGLLVTARRRRRQA